MGQCDEITVKEDYSTLKIFTGIIHMGIITARSFYGRPME